MLVGSGLDLTHALAAEFIQIAADGARTLAQRVRQLTVTKLQPTAATFSMKAHVDIEEFSKDLDKIFHAARESQARTALHEFKAKWGQVFPSAVAVIEKDIDALPRFFQFDPAYWTVLRTTNPIERLNKEFKRRTRAMEVTAGEISTYRCLVYVAQTMEYRWSFHPLSQWTFIDTQKMPLDRRMIASEIGPSKPTKRSREPLPRPRRRFGPLSPWGK